MADSMESYEDPGSITPFFIPLPAWYFARHMYFTWHHYMEMPMQIALYKMETIGFPTSEESIRKLNQDMQSTLKKLEQRIYKINRAKFNLGCSSAVAKVLGLNRKANGRVCTSKQILEKIDSPISNLIMTYRKLKSAQANIESLLKVTKNNRTYSQSISFTATGRISMYEPNLQNVAKNFEVDLGNEKVDISCRSVFFPPPGKCLISSDFCQLEMRILAHLSQDKLLLDVMSLDTDIFTAISAKWHRIPDSEVSEDVRNGTKQICYGIIYGMGMKSLADSLKCTEQEATMLSEQFHASYPGIRTYIQKVIKFAKSSGYVETITGRRRYLDQIDSPEPQVRSQAERQAVNSTIQGSAADLVKKAFVKVEQGFLKYISKVGCNLPDINFVLHLHDELLFEVPEDKARKISKIIKFSMENSVRLSVPLKVKIKVGKSWGELKEISI